VPTPGVETPLTTDVVDGVDVGDVMEGVGVDGLRRPRRVRRVGWWFEKLSACGCVDGNRGKWHLSSRRWAI